MRSPETLHCRSAVHRVFKSVRVAAPGRGLRSIQCGLSLICLSILLTSATTAQTGQSSQAPAQPTSNSTPLEDGREMGTYQVQQSIEFGYRFTDVTGSQAMYGT